MNDTVAPKPARRLDRRSNAANGDRGAFAALVAILALALLVGGGGSKFGFANLIVQLGALLALSFHQRAFGQFFTEAPWPLRGLVIVSLILPVSHIIPLPPSVWEGLPGRELIAQSLKLASPESGNPGWTPFSVDHIRTLLALSALIIPISVLTIGWTVPRERLILTGWLILAIAIVHVLLGTVQVLSNGESGLLYPQNPMPGVLFGFFANRNSAGLFLVGALALAILLPPLPRMARAEFLMRAGTVTLLLLAIALTRSRTALVLAALPFGLGTLRYLMTGLRSEAGPVREHARAVMIVGVLGAIAVAAVLAIAPGRVGDTIERFEGSGPDPRAYIWDDALYSAGRYWPVGSGLGTFDEVFQVDESLENLAQLRAGRAHGDYIEIAIEAGVPGLAVAGAWLCLVAWLAWCARRSPGRWIAWSGGAILVAIALQSITDYPLRNLSMLGFAAFALLLLVRFGEPSKRSEGLTGKAL